MDDSDFDWPLAIMFWLAACYFFLPAYGLKGILLTGLVAWSAGAWFGRPAFVLADRFIALLELALFCLAWWLFFQFLAYLFK